MGENLKLLILATKKATRKGGLRFKLDRRRELGALSAVRAKVCHDSGGRLIVVEVPEGAEKELLKRLPGARLAPVDADVKDSIKDPDPTESLFLEALKIRTSKSYRDAKKKRKFGETPEEKKLTGGSCVRGY